MSARLLCSYLLRLTDLVDLDTLILRNDTGTRARRIEQHAVETSDNPGELSAVDVGDDDVAAPESRDVTAQSLDATSTRVVRPNFTGVAHQRRHVRRLSSRCCRHVENSLVRLRVKRDNGQER